MPDPAGGPAGPATDRPYTLLSCGMSIDGYLSSGTTTRLLLSNDADFDRVDAERAASDAILVGAGTIRKDNPRLLVRSPERRAARVAQGLAPSPMKVTVTRRAELDCAASFFAADGADKLVYCPSTSVAEARGRLGAAAAVVDAGRALHASTACARTSATAASAASWSRVGGRCTPSCSRPTSPTSSSSSSRPSSSAAPKPPVSSETGDFPWNPDRRATLAEVRQIGDVVLLRYALSPRFSRS